MIKNSNWRENFRSLPNGPLSPAWLKRLAEHKKVLALVGPPRCGKTELVQKIPPDVYCESEDQLMNLLDELNGLLVLDRNCRIILDQTVDSTFGDRVLRTNLLLVGTKPGREDFFTCRMLGLVPGLHFEINEESVKNFWLRGGLPESFFASDDDASKNFRRWYLEFYDCKELSSNWDLVLQPVDSRVEYRIPWDSGLYLASVLEDVAPEGEIIMSPNTDLAWESCVVRIVEGGVSLLDPTFTLYKKFLRGYHLFLVESGAIRLAVIPTLKNKLLQFPINKLLQWLSVEKIPKAYLIRPSGPLVELAKRILVGGASEVIKDIRLSYHLN